MCVCNELGSYEKVPSVWLPPSGTRSEAARASWEKARLWSLTATLVLQPLAHMRNNVLAGDFSKVLKGSLVTLCATGMAVGGLVCGVAEALIRLMIAVFIAVSLIFFDMNMIPYRYLDSAELNLRMGFVEGFVLAKKSLCELSNVGVSIQPKMVRELYTTRCFKWCNLDTIQANQEVS